MLQSAQEECSPKQCVKPKLKEGLIHRKTRLESQLADINAAIEALNKNPEVARVLELVGKAKSLLTISNL